jgi:hypothetical protein
MTEKGGYYNKEKTIIGIKRGTKQHQLLKKYIKKLNFGKDELIYPKKLEEIKIMNITNDKNKIDRFLCYIKGRNDFIQNYYDLPKYSKLLKNSIFEFDKKIVVGFV